MVTRPPNPYTFRSVINGRTSTPSTPVTNILCLSAQTQSVMIIYVIYSHRILYDRL